MDAPLPLADLLSSLHDRLAVLEANCGITVNTEAQLEAPVVETTASPTAINS